jgi:hypothetical protein
LLFFPDVELTHTVSRQQRQRHVAFDSSWLFPDVLVSRVTRRSIRTVSHVLDVLVSLCLRRAPVHTNWRV